MPTFNGMKASDEIVPISALFFDGPGPHIVRAGFPPRGKTQPQYTPARGQELQELLNTSIVKLGAVSGESVRKTPIRVPPPVAIDTLLYRGRAALDRALEVRAEIITGGPQGMQSRLEELLDLVALAATE
jgi:hypothetical protein